MSLWSLSLEVNPLYARAGEMTKSDPIANSHPTRQAGTTRIDNRDDAAPCLRQMQAI